MSRIGNKVIPVPSGVKVQLKDGSVEVQGPKGKMSVVVPRGIPFEQKDGTLVAKRDSDDNPALHGLARALVANAVTGVTQGFKKDLDIVGVGYRAEVKGKNVVLALGYSHPIEFPIPEGIQITVEKQTHMTVTGADKNQVGQMAANLRALRPPDPYKQKGIRITGERLKKKAGKAGAKTQLGLARRARKRRTSVAAPVRKLSREAHRRRIHVRMRKSCRHAGASASLRAPLEQAHSRASDRRRRRDAPSFPPVRSTRKCASHIKGGGNIAASKVVGKVIAERARAKGVEKVVFDRGGYQYHGRVQALAEAAREAGLKF